MKRFLFFLLFLIGCSSPKPLVVYETIETNVCENNTIYIVNETIKYINETCPTCVNRTVYVNQSNTSNTLSLIRQLKYCEKQIDKYININVSDCMTELENCENDLNRTLERLREIVQLE